MTNNNTNWRITVKTTFLSLTLAGVFAAGLGLAAASAMAEPPNGIPPVVRPPTPIHGLPVRPHPGIHGIPYRPCIHGVVRPGHGRRCPPPGLYGRRPPGLYGHHPGLGPHPGLVAHPTPIRPGGTGFPGIPVDPAGPGAAAQH
jgi:hypothetical protein